MDKYIFLDIDGVTNSQLWFEKLLKHKKTYNNRLDRFVKKYLDPDAIKLLNTLVENTNAKVVISSSHRVSYELKELQEAFKIVGFTGEIIGKTPKLYFVGENGYNYSVSRGEEIMAWLRINNAENSPYIIFDDDSDMLLKQRENYFRVDNYCGLTPNLIYRATIFLNKFSPTLKK